MSKSKPKLHSNTRLISIVRENGQLMALLNHPAEQKNKSPGDASDEKTEIDWGRLFEFRKSPIHTLPKSIHPLSERLSKAWNRIAHVRYVDQATLDSILTILLHSVPASNAGSVPLPSLDLQDKGKKCSPTSARPRASKGTKDRPPKPPQPEAIDLRPYLTSCDGTQRVLRRFQALLPQVVPGLAKKGFLPSSLVNSMNLSELIPFLTLPGLHRRSMKEELGRIPSLFLQHLLPGMGLKPTKEIRRLLSIFYAMNLQSNDTLLATVSRFVCLKENPHLLPWCEVLAEQPEAHRAAFLVLVMGNHCHTKPPTSQLTEGLKELNALATDSTYHLWVTRFLEGWKQGISLEYMLAGFRLANQFYPHYGFYSIKPCHDFPETLVEDLACYFHTTSKNDHGFRVLRLWERSGELPQFIAALKRIRWFDFSPQNAFRLAAMILDVCWFYEDHRNFHQKWKMFKEELPAIEELLRTVPNAFQNRALAELRGIAQQDEEICSLRTRLKRAFPLIRRICRAPFDPDVDASDLNELFISFSSQRLVTQFLHAPDSSFHALEDIARRDNVERLVTYGLASLIKGMPEFTGRCFRTFPRHLFQASKALGCLSYPVRSDLVKSLDDHPLFTNELEYLPIREACQRILEFCGTHLWNPVPHYLARWARGNYTLTPKRIARYFQICFDNLDRTRLALVEERALAILGRGLPKPSFQGTAKHAVQLIGSMDQNKKGLRRFLTAYWSGNIQYLENHQATRLWLKHHPLVNLSKWKNGVHLQGIVKGKAVHLQFEDDPLEVLKMGTYVGSCLSLGGAFSESAAAVLLDINKQVIYARDSEDRVIGRQLVAISEKDELVCFEVYPHNVGPEVIALFWKYDRALSKHLGLKIYQTPKEYKEEDYKVKEILSEYWLDDGAWTMHLPQPAKKAKKKLGTLIHP